MSLIILNNDTHVELRNMELTNRCDHIPPSVYRVRLALDDINLVKDRKNFVLPKKIYGKHHHCRDTIVKSYMTEENAMGVLLIGLKGSGEISTGRRRW